MPAPITTLDEFEADFRKGIGVETDLNQGRFLLEATRDNIVNFADAIGDNNPLWSDEDYANRSRFGGVTAPPTFLYNINHGSRPSNIGTISRPVQNLSLLYSGAEWEFLRPIRMGTGSRSRGSQPGPRGSRARPWAYCCLSRARPATSIREGNSPA